MKPKRFALSLAATSALLVAPAVHAADSDRYGSLATGMPYDREIRVDANRSIGVWRRETIRFVTSGGREFRWRFDTTNYLDRFPLASIAPKELDLPAGATVYVNGELPVSGDQ